MKTKHLFQIASAIAICMGMPSCLELPKTDSGSLANIHWTYDFETKVLTLSGTGEITQVARSAEGTGHGYLEEDYHKTYFKYTHYPETIIINEGFSKIGIQAFWMFDRATTISIPDGITEIGKEAFYLCESLTFVNIPNSVTHIGSEAFSCCGLTSVTIPSSVKVLEQYAFERCALLMSAIIGDGVTSIENHTFAECHYLSSVIIGKNIKKIENYAFHTCSRLVSVTCYATTPPDLSTTAFYCDDSNGDISIRGWDQIEKIDLFVPAGSINAYKNNPNWKKFRSISAIQ